MQKKTIIIRVVEEINSTILRRSWIRFQGASTGAYFLSVPIDATKNQKTDSKTSKMVEFIFSTTLLLIAAIIAVSSIIFIETGKIPLLLVFSGIFVIFLVFAI